MTNEELIEKVARSLCGSFPGAGDVDEHFKEGCSVKEMWIDLSRSAISTILAELQEPTEEMMKTIGATSVQRLVWHKMLSASPLAPKEE